MLERIAIPVMITMLVFLAILAIVAFIVRNNNYDKVFGYVGIVICIIVGIFLLWMGFQIVRFGFI
jgi:lipopolysaccharide export LptBFGC system permease protein LptF